jgi:hypothetical protein
LEDSSSQIKANLQRLKGPLGSGTLGSTHNPSSGASQQSWPQGRLLALAAEGDVEEDGRVLRARIDGGDLGPKSLVFRDLEPDDGGVDGAARPVAASAKANWVIRDEPFAAAIVYPSVVVAWTYLT